jgi:hypothetical protein
MSDTSDKTAPVVKDPPWEEALSNLDKVSKEVDALAKDDKGNPLPGMNPNMHEANVVVPLRRQLNDPKTRNVEAFKKALALKAEPPLVSKFFKNPIK